MEIINWEAFKKIERKDLTCEELIIVIEDRDSEIISLKHTIQMQEDSIRRLEMKPINNSITPYRLTSNGWINPGWMTDCNNNI